MTMMIPPQLCFLLCRLVAPFLLIQSVQAEAAALVDRTWNICGARIASSSPTPGPAVTGSFVIDVDISPPYRNIAIQSNGVTYSNILSTSPGNSGFLLALAGPLPTAGVNLTGRQLITLTFATALANAGGQVPIALGGLGTCGDPTCSGYSPVAALANNNPFVSTSACPGTPTPPAPTPPAPSPNSCRGPTGFFEFFSWLFCLFFSLFS